MRSVLLKQSHEELWLREGYLLAMQFAEGWVCFRILGWEPSNVKPYRLAASLAAGAQLAAWDEIKDSETRRYTEPPDERFIHHYFFGINHPAARVYFQYPSRQDRRSLVAVERAVGGDVGYVDGDMSPYDGPFSLKSEFFTASKLYPAFQVYNPLADTIHNVLLNLDVMRYTYQLLKDSALVQRILLGEVRRRMYTVGGADPSPVSAPSWLQEAAGKELMAWTQKLMETGG